MIHTHRLVSNKKNKFQKRPLLFKKRSKILGPAFSIFCLNFIFLNSSSAMDRENTEESKQTIPSPMIAPQDPLRETLELLLTKPEGIVELPASFSDQKEDECAEIISPAAIKDKVRVLTNDFMKQKNRKSADLETEHAFTTILRSHEIPLTYLTALSIDGGGIKGLIPALLLERLSHKLSKPLPYYFDYMGGTSIGGISILEITTPGFGGNISELVKLFGEKRKQVFPPNGKVKGFEDTLMHNTDGTPYMEMLERHHTKFPLFPLISCRYSEKGLESLLKETFGEKTFLHETLTNILVTAVDIGFHRPQTYLFDSRKAKKLYENDQVSIPLWQVARSTSAAPTYFPAYDFTMESGQRIMAKHTLIDGGLWVNNPSNLVMRALLNFASDNSLYASHENCIMLSLGTGYSRNSSQLSKNAGNINAARPTIDTLMEVSSLGTHEYVQETLGRKNYARINPELSEAVELDEIRTPQLDILRKAAESKFEEIDAFIDGPFRRALEQDEFVKQLPHKNSKL